MIEIGDFIARDKPMAAAGWVRRLVEAAERTALFPSSGRVVPEVDRADIREVILDNYPMVYLVETTRIVILTVFESHRLLRDDDLDPTASR